MDSFEFKRGWSTMADMERTLLHMSKITKNNANPYVPPIELPIRESEVREVKPPKVTAVRGRGALLNQLEQDSHPEFKAHCIREELEKLGNLDYSDSAIEKLLVAPGQFDDFASDSNPVPGEPSFATSKSKNPADFADFGPDEQLEADVTDDVDNSTEASVDASDLSTSIDIDFANDPMRRYGFSESYYCRIEPNSIVGRSKTPSPCSSPLPNRTLIEEDIDVPAIDIPPVDVPTVDSAPRLNGERETWECLDAIKNKFFSEPDVFDEFMTIMKDWKNDLINSRTMFNRVSKLLSKHPDILDGFKSLISEETLPTVNSAPEKPVRKPGQADMTGPKRCRNALVLALLKREVDEGKGDVDSSDVALRYAGVVKDWIETQSDDRPANPHLGGAEASGLVLTAVSAALEELTAEQPKLLRPDDFKPPGDADRRPAGSFETDD